MRCIPIILAITLLGTVAAAAEPGSPARPNILFLVADDLATRLGCYGDPAAITPNLDRLAASGVVFTHAYCQGVVCTPSRTSFMLGLNNRHSRATSFLENPELMTLGRWFRDHGYQTFSVGKIDHTDEYTDPRAWDIRHNGADVKPPRQLGKRTKLQEDLPQSDGSRLDRHLSHIGIADSADQLHDWAVAERAIKFLDTEREPRTTPTIPRSSSWSNCRPMRRPSRRNRCSRSRAWRRAKKCNASSPAPTMPP
jgi:arylsulfatase A-like enzyme